MFLYLVKHARTDTYKCTRIRVGQLRQREQLRAVKREGITGSRADSSSP